MKKSERLNQELIFLQYKKEFNVKTLMEEFQISKCTALRDIRELEYMGLALYTDFGCKGKYHVINQNLLTPVYFNEEEIASILFAIQALEKLTQTPFDKSWPQIYQKLLATLPKDKQLSISDLLSNIYYKGVPSVSKVNFLKEVLLAAQEGRSLTIRYHQTVDKEMTVYILDLFFQDGAWYCNGYDIHNEVWEILRCDCIESCQSYIKKDGRPFADKTSARNNLLSYQLEKRTFSFQCELSPFGKELFIKTDYFGMNLQEDGNKIILTGAIEEKDMDYLIQYLISFGNNIKILSPNSLVKSYIAALETLITSYK